MKRKEFVKLCGIAMLGVPVMGSILTSCQSIYYAQNVQEENNLIIPLSEFEIEKKGKKTYRQYVLVNSPFGFPICLYRFSDQEFKAALMKCTHRGCELNVGGGIYSCPCHGSEFDPSGNVLEGPADEDLQMFKTKIKDEKIYIALS